ncbi:MAG: CBS domain-containing protein, partial [Romboutsia timonensis]
DINKMPVGMIMTRTPNVITTNKEDDVVLAAKKIIEHEVDSIPVVEINEEDTNQIKVIGRLSKTNITKLFLEIADN